jgi:hypothetical protein
MGRESKWVMAVKRGRTGVQAVGMKDRIVE